MQKWKNMPWSTMVAAYSTSHNVRALREFVNIILGQNDDITRFEYQQLVEQSPVIEVTLANKYDYASLVNHRAFWSVFH